MIYNANTPNILNLNISIDLPAKYGTLCGVTSNLSL